MGKTKKEMIEKEDDWTREDVQPEKEEEEEEQEEEDVLRNTLKYALRLQSESKKLLDAMNDIWVLAELHKEKYEMDGDEVRGILRTICAVCQFVSQDVLADLSEAIEGDDSDED